MNIFTTIVYTFAVFGAFILICSVALVIIKAANDFWYAKFHAKHKKGDNR